MVKIGFIVEGDCEKILIESAGFQEWAKQQNIEICKPIINAKGNGNLLPSHIDVFVEQISRTNPTVIVILTDLEDAASPETVKARIGTTHTNFVFIAIKALEAWFLADSQALKNWLKTSHIEAYPENTQGLPWDRVKEIAKQYERRGPGSKVTFAKHMVTKNSFSIARAAAHGACSSAKEFHDTLIQLGQTSIQR